MCLIIDANRATVVFAHPTPDDFQPIFDWIEKHGGILVIGGHLRVELWKVGDAKRRIMGWIRAGRAHLVPDEKLIERQKQLMKSAELKSDDPHVLALALFTGARVLCTVDKALMNDFRNGSIIQKPRGGIYQRPEHRKLLKHHPGCQGPRTSR